MVICDENENRGELAQFNEKHLQKLQLISSLLMKGLVLTQRGYTVSPLLFDMIPEVLVSPVRQEKEIKDVR